MVALLESPTFRLVSTPIERREHVRKIVYGRADGRRLDHSLPARRQPQLNLRLQDLSAGGLAATCDVPVLRGERLVVRVPRHGLSGGWDAIGRVVRCDAADAGYRVAVEFDPTSSAA